MAIKGRKSEKCPPGMINADERGMRNHAHALLTAIIRMRPPADISEQTGRMAQAPLIIILARIDEREELIRPPHEFGAVARRARAQRAQLAGGA